MVNLKAVRRITRTGLTLSDVELSIVIGNLLDNTTGGLLPLLRRDPGVRCIVQRGSHRQLLAEEAVCPAVARSGAA